MTSSSSDSSRCSSPASCSSKSKIADIVVLARLMRNARSKVPTRSKARSDADKVSRAPDNLASPELCLSPSINCDTRERELIEPREEGFFFSARANKRLRTGCQVPSFGSRSVAFAECRTRTGLTVSRRRGGGRAIDQSRRASRLPRTMIPRATDAPVFECLSSCLRRNNRIGREFCSAKKGSNSRLFKQ